MTLNFEINSSEDNETIISEASKKAANIFSELIYILSDNNRIHSYEEVVCLKEVFLEKFSTQVDVLCKKANYFLFEMEKERELQRTLENNMFCERSFSEDSD